MNLLLHADACATQEWQGLFSQGLSTFHLNEIVVLFPSAADEPADILINLTGTLLESYEARRCTFGQWMIHSQLVTGERHLDQAMIEVAVFATRDNQAFYLLSKENHKVPNRSFRRNCLGHDKAIASQLICLLKRIVEGNIFPFEEKRKVNPPKKFIHEFPRSSPIFSVEKKIQRIKQNFMLERWHCGLLPLSLKHESDFKKIPSCQPLWTAPCDEREDFKADPFGLYRDGYYYLLYEHYNDALRKGEIRYEKLSIIEHAICTHEKGVALRLEEHLSYPFLFEDHGETYMLPECHQSGGVQLYRAVDFPGKWEHCRTLIPNFKGVDNSIFFYNKMWWIFCTSADADSNLRLFIWYAEDLFGPWKEHQLNPVKADIRSSRPGGTPFVLDGHLYRPAQNSIATYGGGLVINKITELSPASFAETPVCDFSGFVPFEKGFHTFSLCNGMIFIDGKDYIVKPKYVFFGKR